MILSTISFMFGSLALILPLSSS